MNIAKPGTNAKDTLFSVTRKIDPALTEVFNVAYRAFNKVTTLKALNEPHYRALMVEEQRVRGNSKQRSLDEVTILFNIWRQKEDIEQHLSLYPGLELWLNRAGSSAPATTVAREIVFAWQRVTRGWDDRSVWSLDWSLCKTLGAQLIYLADTSHGWPGNDTYVEFEHWEDALRFHGSVLSQVAIFSDDIDGETQRIESARLSLHWVADNLGHLWD